MKTCTKCGLPKEDNEYSWSIRNIKKHSSCNSCRAAERMDYYERNKEKELAYKWLTKPGKLSQTVENYNGYEIPISYINWEQPTPR